MTEGSSHNHDYASPIRRRLTTPVFVISAAFVALILVGGTAFAVGTLIGGDGDGTADSASDPDTDGETSPDPGMEGEISSDEVPEQERHSTSPTPSAEGDSACGLEGNDKDNFAQFPEGTEWEAVGATQAPSHPDYGPGETSDAGVRHCYSYRPPARCWLRATLWR